MLVKGLKFKGKTIGLGQAIIVNQRELDEMLNFFRITFNDLDIEYPEVIND